MTITDEYGDLQSLWPSLKPWKSQSMAKRLLGGIFCGRQGSPIEIPVVADSCSNG